MAKPNIELDMKKLVADLNRFAYHYYVLDDPIISDQEYDALFDRLLEMEKETGTILPDSPSQRVGGAILSRFSPYRHRAKLWSLDKVQSDDELNLWENRIRRIMKESAFADKIPHIEYLVEYKYDGLTINLTYENGMLTQAATRGNGEVGEGILEQVKTIRSIPLTIPFKGIVEIQGEGLMRLSVLGKYNETAAEPLKNARNAAAGALRNLNPQVTAARRLDAFFYNIGYIEGYEIRSQSEVFDFLRNNHLPVSHFLKRAESIQEVAEIVEKAKGQILEGDYLIDGLVIKVNSFSLRDMLGYTDRFPRWAVAYKLEAQEVTTLLEDVQWNIGRTGKLTPVAILEPVHIGGVTVRRATLNNWNDILRKRIRIGCQVWLRRSNDVIPEVMGVVQECPDGQSIDKPTHCPSCGSILVEIGAHLYCQNSMSCQPQLIYRLAHFASRDALDIEGLSVKTAERLVQEGIIKEVADLFSVSKEDLQKLDGFGDKKIDNLLSAIEKSKKPALSEFLFALGIPNIGKKSAKDLASHYESMDRIIRASQTELENIPDIGVVSAAAIVKYFGDPQILRSLETMKCHGVRPIEPEAKDTRADSVFSGKTVVITGSLSRYSRREVTDHVEALGGTVGNTVNKKTDLLIVGENPGSKLEKAKTLGIQIFEEKEFQEMIEGEKP